MPPCNQIRQTIQSDATGLRQNAVPIEGDALMGCCEKEAYILTLGGRIRCPRCQAKSKRSQQQCRSPAIRGKRVCKVHGGRSTGPRTQQGRNLCGAAKTLHGRETRAIRAKRQQALAELRLIERMGKGFGIM
ncbi:hypothetical protein OAX71_04255 [Pseudomonadales bacterium]|nr:hypothetical protein [Pseudomonadales bacterium]